MTMDICFADEADFALGLVNCAFQVESFFIDGDRLDRQRLRGYFKKRPLSGGKRQRRA